MPFNENKEKENESLCCGPRDRTAVVCRGGVRGGGTGVWTRSRWRREWVATWSRPAGRGPPRGRGRRRGAARASRPGTTRWPTGRFPLLTPTSELLRIGVRRCNGENKASWFFHYLKHSNHFPREWWEIICEYWWHLRVVRRQSSGRPMNLAVFCFHLWRKTKAFLLW